MNTEQFWFAIEITADSEAAEAIEFGLNELDALGTEINNLGVRQPTETLVVNGYFPKMPEDEIVRQTLNEALRIYDFAPEAIRAIGSRRIGNVDWLYEWKKHWKPTETAKFIVAPSWENVENTEKIVVRIEPNMAFGTGTHETTRLCLKAIEENYESGMSFLDVGTGTGILSIAAAKLNAAPEISNRNFLAYDTDLDSIGIAKENAELNQVGNKIDFRVGSISEEIASFDFVCANITIDVITPILPLLIARSKKILVLSGILKEQESLIESELKKLRIEDFRVENQGEWISVAVRFDNL